MNTNRQRLFNLTTAHRAKLASPSGVNFRSGITSVRGFVIQKEQKLTPTGIPYAFAYVGAGKANDIEFLDKDNPILIDQLAAQFMMKVKPLVGYLFMKVTNLTGQFGIPATALFTTGTYLLEPGEFRFTDSKPTRVINQFAGRQGGKVFKAHVNSNAFGWRGQRFHVWQFNLKDRVPVTQVVTLDDCHSNDAIGQGAMLKHSNFTHALDVEPVSFESKPVTVDIANRFPPIFAFIAWEAWLKTALYSLEKSIKSLVEFAQGLLNRGVIDKGGVLIKGANCLKLVSLVNIANAFSVHLPGKASLGQGVVVQASVDFKDTVKRLTLFSIGIKTVFIREIHSILSALAFSRMITSKTATWLMPSLSESNFNSLFPSSERRILVGNFSFIGLL